MNRADVRTSPEKEKKIGRWKNARWHFSHHLSHFCLFAPRNVPAHVGASFHTILGSFRVRKKREEVNQRGAQAGKLGAGRRNSVLCHSFQRFTRLVFKGFKCIPLFSCVGKPIMARKDFISQGKDEFLRF